MRNPYREPYRGSGSGCTPTVFTVVLVLLVIIAVLIITS